MKVSSTIDSKSDSGFGKTHVFESNGEPSTQVHVLFRDVKLSPIHT